MNDTVPLADYLALKADYRAESAALAQHGPGQSKKPESKSLLAEPCPWADLVK